MIWLFIVITVLLLILFLLCPTLRQHPDKKLCKNLYVAHRGLHDIENGIPENSLLAYKNALAHGYAIEIDIHITKDGKVAVFHDDDLKRMCGVDKKIEDLTEKELKKYFLLDTKEKIPMLEEVLDIVDGKVCLVIEFKCNQNNYKQLCIAANEILKNYKGKYIVQSFNPLAMGWYKNNRKDICRGQLSSHFIKSKNKDLVKILIGYLLLNVISRPDFISYNHKFTNVLQRRICIMLGAISAGWTFRNQKELDKHKNEYQIYIFEGFIPN